MNTVSLVKAYVLTHGVQFSLGAMQHSRAVNAKRQNVVYNLPATGGVCSDSMASKRLAVATSTDELARPQELFLEGDDGYTVCVSAVAPVFGRAQAIVDFQDGGITIHTPSHPEMGAAIRRVEFVPQPEFYELKTSQGRAVTRWVSACGYDEMNVWPWHDCAISKTCTFCGINSVQKQAGREIDLVHALNWRKSDAMQQWINVRESVLAEISEAVDLAIDDAKRST
ncbi:MAG TPA: hypothetical protein EYO05_04775 [Gammaproteobacteria bacterium]|nr:hypothetical protein [Gammaproteobacteria bacterium]